MDDLALLATSIVARHWGSNLEPHVSGSGRVSIQPKPGVRGCWIHLDEDGWVCDTDGSATGLGMHHTGSWSEPDAIDRLLHIRTVESGGKPRGIA